MYPHLWLPFQLHIYIRILDKLPVFYNTTVTQIIYIYSHCLFLFMDCCYFSTLLNFFSFFVTWNSIFWLFIFVSVIFSHWHKVTWVRLGLLKWQNTQKENKHNNIITWYNIFTCNGLTHSQKDLGQSSVRSCEWPVLDQQGDFFCNTYCKSVKSVNFFTFCTLYYFTRK